MDGTINDFFNEIDQIAPPTETKNESAWQECYDSSSGYSYYWNVKTDEVTWEIPEEYKLWKEQNISHKPGHLYVPPKSSPLFPSTTLSSTKIYKIQNDSQNLPTDGNRKAPGQTLKRNVASDPNKNAKKLHVDSHNATEEKIVLISSYGDDSEESDPETDKRTASVPLNKTEPTVVGPHFPNEMPKQPTSNSNSQTDSDNEDDIDLLTQIQNRAKVLKDLGGELPPAVKKLVEKKDLDTKTEEPLEKCTKKEKKNVTGFLLLAGYGDSDDEEIQATVPLTNENQKPVSTLFPVSKPIDIAQFSEREKELKSSETENIVDSRAFHRKRRINIDFSNKKTKTEPDTNHSLNEIGNERQGLGFKKELDNDQNVDEPKTKSKADYPGFQRGGLMFVKSDPLLPPTVEPEKKELQIHEDADKSKSETMQTIEETRKMLNEKLNFLCEGREAASPVQVMIIQMETLYEAVKVGSLTVSYLHKWLKETCSELIKLEKDAAPSGWLLQWDRINKRYYYRNQQTGDSQWEYPQPDIVGGDEAMDISTTPPPPIDDLVPAEPVTSTMSTTFPLQPPPPPRIKSPTPPPPPTISRTVKQKKKGKSDNPLLPTETPPMPPPPLPKENLNLHGEPLPPGVESSEITSYKSASPPPLPATEDKLPPQSNAGDTLGSAINSFYSDLAALESETTTTPAADVVPISAPAPVAPSPVLQHTENITPSNTGDDAVTKKKKKTKVKLVQGLAMKKKGVSKLVERWKNVQKDY